jgi:hypothetical protein
MSKGVKLEQLGVIDVFDLQFMAMGICYIAGEPQLTRSN